MSIRKPFEKRDRVSLKFDSPSMAKQSFKNECDINNIVKRYHTTGMISHISRSKPFYGDFIDSLEYRTALDKIREADALFDALPATIRAEFKNDPSSFLEFCQNPENKEKMLQMGLLQKSDISASNNDLTTGETQ